MRRRRANAELPISCSRNEFHEFVVNVFRDVHLSHDEELFELERARASGVFYNTGLTA